MPQRVHFPSLDGIRAVAISMVIVCHAFLFYPAPLSLPNQLLAFLGVTGVKIFFCLSGYLITRLLLIEEEKNGRIDLPAFYKRRAIRILPIALIYILVIVLLFRGRIATLDYLLSLLFLQDFFNGSWVLSHLWSLSVEQQFYLFWPLAFRVGRKRISILVTIFLAVQLINLALYKFSFFLDGRAIYSVADTLAAGCLVAIFAGNSAVKSYIARPAFPVLTLASLVLLYLFYPFSTLHLNYPFILARAVITPLCYLVIAASIHHFVIAPGMVLNLKFVRYLGKISYSMYLWQQLIIEERRTDLATSWSAWINIPLTLLLIFLVSMLSYELVEKQFFRLRKFA